MAWLTPSTGLGWAGLSFQLPALFTPFPRKRNWNGCQRRDQDSRKGPLCGPAPPRGRREEAR